MNAEGIDVDRLVLEAPLFALGLCIARGTKEGEAGLIPCDKVETDGEVDDTLLALTGGERKAPGFVRLPTCGSADFGALGD